MAANFILRTSKTDGEATLFVRIQNRTPKINIRVSTDLKVNIAEWNKSLEDAKQLDKYRKGKGKNLYEKLDRISNVIEVLIKEKGESLSSDLVKDAIHSIVFAEEIAAQKKQEEEEQRRLKEEAEKAIATTFNGFVEQYISECEEGKRKKKKSTKNISAGTIKSYKGFYSQLKEYQKNRYRVIDFQDLNVDFYNDFQLFLTEKQYSPNTIARMTKICKTICYAAEQLKLMDASNVRSTFDVAYKDVDNVYLTENRVQQLYELDLSNRPAWEKVRDVFVVGCLTGQRVSDYKRINSDMIERLQDGNKYIGLTQKKTGILVYIPLDYRVESILNKYNGVLPKVYDQKINDYIKSIGEHLGWVEVVNIREQRGSLEYTANKRFCDMIMTHTARRSFATNMYKAGASLASIQAITGHSSEQQLKTYLKLNEKEKAMQAIKENSFFKFKMAR